MNKRTGTDTYTACHVLRGMAQPSSVADRNRSRFGARIVVHSIDVNRESLSKVKLSNCRVISAQAESQDTTHSANGRRVTGGVGGPH